MRFPNTRRALTRAWLAAILPLLLATPLTAQQGGLFDAETGLWFPEGTSKDSFLDGTAPRAYPVELSERLKDDEVLREKVCSWILDPKNEVDSRSVSGRVLQLRTMAAMVCIGIASHRESRKQIDAQEQAAERRYREWLDLDAARKLDPATRARRASELYAGIASLPEGGEARLRAALGAVGLVPEHDAYLLAAMTSRLAPGSVPGHHQERFLRDLLTTEAQRTDVEGRRWRLGLRGWHYFHGEFAEARRLTVEAIEHPFLDQHDYDRVFLALLDRILGDRTGWDARVAACPTPDSFRDGMGRGRSGPSYCRVVAFELARRGIEALGEKSPAALKEVLVEGIAAAPTSWGMRMESIRALQKVDRARARVEAAAVLEIPATLSPAAAQFDAVAVLATLAREDKDWTGALAALDRYLDLVGFRRPPIPADLWQRLRTIPHVVRAEPPCADPFCRERWALVSKVDVDLLAGDEAGARRALEVWLAAELRDAGRQGAGPEALERAAAGVRGWLQQFARARLAAGDRAAALRITGFLYNQPNEDRPGTGTTLSGLRAELTRQGGAELKKEESPWGTDDGASTSPPGR